MKFEQTRGFRNNNPFNIKRTATRWQGKRTEIHDKTFEEFVEVKYGFRAAFIILRRYVERYRLTSVRDIIARWAPSTENDVDRYSDYINYHYHINEVHSDKDFRYLMSAIAWYESNYALTYNNFYTWVDEFMLEMPKYPK